MSNVDSRKFGVAAGAGIAASLLYAYRNHAPWSNSTSTSVDTRYQGGESYTDPKTLSTGLGEDLKALGLKAGQADLDTLVKVAFEKGKPVDDKQMTVDSLGLCISHANA